MMRESMNDAGIHDDRGRKLQSQAPVSICHVAFNHRRLLLRPEPRSPDATGSQGQGRPRRLMQAKTQSNRSHEYPPGAFPPGLGKFPLLPSPSHPPHASDLVAPSCVSARPREVPHDRFDHPPTAASFQWRVKLTSSLHWPVKFTSYTHGS